MKDKLELLLHIDAPTRKEVLQWCRDYEAEISYLKRQSQLLSQNKRSDSETELINYTVDNVGTAIKRKGSCSVFYNGRFKVLTQAARIEKETSIFVGKYDTDFKSEYLIEDLICTLNDVKANCVPTAPSV